MTSIKINIVNRKIHYLNLGLIEWKCRKIIWSNKLSINSFVSLKVIGLIADQETSLQTAEEII